MRNEIIAGMTERCARTMPAGIRSSPRSITFSPPKLAPLSSRDPGGRRGRERPGRAPLSHLHARFRTVDSCVRNHADITRPGVRRTRGEIDRPINHTADPRTRRYSLARIIYSHRVYKGLRVEAVESARGASYFIAVITGEPLLLPPPPRLHEAGASLRNAGHTTRRGGRRKRERAREEAQGLITRYNKTRQNAS